MGKRWLIVFFVLVVWTGKISQQPIASPASETPISHETNETARRPRDCGCCPCTSMDASRSMDSVGESTRSAGVVGGLEECPCRVRDSESAASSLFDIPGQMRALGAFVSPTEPKEDTKPLLHPEVGLAHSFLQTLRVATEEEYKDAKARDAARAAADPGTDEPTPETSRNIVTIILNPHPLPGQDEDILGSGTHTHESRCIHPLGNLLESDLLLPKSSLLTDIIHRPSLGMLSNGRSSLLHLDNGRSASNVHETVVESPRVSELQKAKSSLNKLVTDGKSNKIRLSGSKQSDSRNSDPCASEMLIKEKINRLGNLVSAPKALEIYDYMNSVMSPSSSNVQEVQVENIPGKKENSKLRSIPLTENKGSMIRPILPKNLLKLKDVELIPSSRNSDNKKLQSHIPNLLNLPSIDNLFAQSKANRETLKLPTLDDFFRNTIWVPERKITTETNNMMTDVTVAPSTVLDESDRGMHKIETDILDTIPSPSENLEVVSDSDQSFDDIQSKSAKCNTLNNKNEFQISDAMKKMTENVNSNTEASENLDKQQINTSLIDSESDENNIDSSSIEGQDDVESNIQEPSDSNIEFSTSSLEIIPNMDLKNNDVDEISDEDSNEIIEEPQKSLEDLKNLSDSILDASNKQEFKAKALRINNCADTEDPKIKQSENEDIQQSSTETETVENNEDQPVVESSEDNNVNVDQVIDKTCPSEQDSAKFTEVDNNENTGKPIEPSEMEVGASEPLGSYLPNNNLLKSILKQDIIVQPSSFINGEKDVLRPHVPTLEELRKGLSSIFGNGNISDQDESNESSEIKSNLDSENDVSMASDGSAPKPLLTLPSQEREINFNIFKLNPLNLGEPLNNLQAINPLNLNSFKARVKMPDTNFKPLKFESTFGKGAGLLGTSLSLEPLHSPHLLSSSGLTLPSLEEMRSTLRAHTEDLLKSQKINLDAQRLRNNQPMRQLGDLRDSLHSNAANAMNNLQQSLASTLNEAKIKTDNLLGNSRFAQPENLLDIARFDVDNKLQEIHSNLADHLSSVHEKLMNPPPLPSLDTLGQPLDFSFLGNPLMPTARKPITSRKSSKARNLTKPTRIQDQDLKFRTSSGNDRRSLKSTLPKSSVSSRNNGIQEKNLGNAFKFKKNQPTVTDKPLRYRNKKKVTIKAPQTSTERSSTFRKIQVSPIRPVPEFKKRVPLRIPHRPESNKFKAAILTTTISPRASDFRANNPKLLAPWTTIIHTTPAPLRMNNIPSSRSSLKLLELPKTRLHSKLFPKDANGLPSDIVSSKSLPDFNTLKSSFDSEKVRNDLLSRTKNILKPKFKVNFSKLDLPERTGSFRQINNGVLKSAKDAFDFPEPEVIPEPKRDLIDNPLLSKLVESFRSSLPSVDVKPFEKDSISTLLGSTLSSLGSPARFRSNTDMTEGASENLQNAIAIDEPLKENVSYKCRMVCTRE